MLIHSSQYVAQLMVISHKTFSSCRLPLSSFQRTEKCLFVDWRNPNFIVFISSLFSILLKHINNLLHFHSSCEKRDFLGRISVHSLSHVCLLHKWQDQILSLYLCDGSLHWQPIVEVDGQNSLCMEIDVCPLPWNQWEMLVFRDRVIFEDEFKIYT